jgi:hypothetical protein
MKINLKEILKAEKNHEKYQKEKLKIALDCMARLSPKRVEDFEQWEHVGKALRSLNEVGLSLWDEWSKKSDKYRPGECSAKWETFTPQESLGSLEEWADKDSPHEVSKAPRNATPEDYRTALLKMGYQFKLNECNDDIIVNGIPMSDILRAVLIYKLKKYNYTRERNAEIAWMVDANDHKFHPVIEYLEGLDWNGEDHIQNLSGYFENIQGVFPIWLKRWMIGCVAKVTAYPQGQQNRMLVLDAKQDAGKSYFVRWLCSGIPTYHVEATIIPDDKDSWIRMMSKWIWEVGELGATTRKSDREALKNFLSTERVTVRKSYGHLDTVKPALANFIGSINNEIGFLNDPTGSRRFMCCTLQKINWNYAKEVDVNQLWAQAVALFKQGEPWNLTEEEKRLSNEINATYEIENPLVQYLVRYFEIDPTHKEFNIDPSKKEWVTSTTDILDQLRAHSVIGYEVTTMSKYVASALFQLGLEKKRARIGASQITVWLGIKQRSPLSPPPIV